MPSPSVPRGHALASVALYRGAEAARWRASAAQERAEHRSYVAHLEAADAAIERVDLIAARDQLEQAAESFPPGWEWFHLHGRLDQSASVLEPTIAPAFFQSLDVDPDGLRLAAGASDGVIYLWSTGTNEFLGRLEKHGHWVRSVAFAPDGSTLVSGAGHWIARRGPGEVRLWDLASGETVARFDGHADAVQAVAFAPDGDVIVTASSDGTVRVLDARTLEERHRLQGHRNEVRDLVFSADGGELVSVGWDGLALRWDAHDFTAPPRPLPMPKGEPLEGIGLVRGGAQYAIGTWQTQRLHLFDRATGAHVDTITGLGRTAYAIVGRANEALLALADGSIRVWDLDAGVETRRLLGHTNDVVRLRLEGDALYSAGADGTIRIFDPDTTDVIALRPGAALGALASDGSFVVITERRLDEFQRVEAHELVVRSIGGAELSRITLPSIAGDPCALAIAPGDTIAGVANGVGECWLFDLESGAMHAVLDGHRRHVWSLAFSSDARSVATASWDGTVRVWSTESGSHLSTLRIEEAQPNALTFTGADELAVGYTDGRIAFWNTASSEADIQIEAHDDAVNALSVSSDGRWLATASSDGRVLLWNVAEHSLERVLSGHARGVSCVAWTPDGSRLATGGDGVILLWEPGTGRRMGTIRAAGRHLSFDAGGRHLVSFTQDAIRVFAGGGDHR